MLKGELKSCPHCGHEVAVATLGRPEPLPDGLAAEDRERVLTVPVLIDGYTSAPIVSASGTGSGQARSVDAKSEPRTGLVFWGRSGRGGDLTQLSTKPEQVHVQSDNQICRRW